MDAMRLWTSDARPLIPVGHGVDAQVTEVHALLTRGGKAPLVAGDQGVGKSAIVQELARRALQGLLGEQLQGSRIVEVTLAGVFARTANPKRRGPIWKNISSPRWTI